MGFKGRRGWRRLTGSCSNVTAKAGPSRETAMRFQAWKSFVRRGASASFHVSARSNELCEPTDGRFDRRGSMDWSDSMSTNLESIAERGLSSFLQAISAVAPDEDLQKASDCWIRALETTDWSASESSDRFVCQVTINAMAIIAKLNGSEFREVLVAARKEIS